MKLSKMFLLASLLFLAATNVTAQHSITKIWETKLLLNIPESALLTKDVIYTSLIDGEPWTADGKGGIAKVGKDGKIIKADWITGLNAPKGMAIIGDLLYVADLNELVVIGISKGKIEYKIKVPGAVGLNDVTADKNGVVWVTDTQKGLVFKVKGKEAALFLKNIPEVNGIKAIGDKLYILGGKAMYVTDASKKLTTIVALEQGGDGIEPVGNGDFIVTAWAGYMYYVNTNKNTKELLLDTHTVKNTADIGFDPATRIIYVPTFSGKSIAAYQLK